VRWGLKANDLVGNGGTGVWTMGHAITPRLFRPFCIVFVLYYTILCIVYKKTVQKTHLIL